MESEQSRKQSLSKAETIEQLRTTINQLEGIIEELDTITVQQLPESPSLETLVQTTEKLAGTISKAKQTPPPLTETPVTEAATVTDTPEEPESGITEEKQTPPPSTETPVTGEATIIDTPEEKSPETSLSKAETIEQLRTTISHLEGIIEELDTITVEQLPESPSLETLVQTTEKLEGVISKAKQTPPPPTETPVTEETTVTDTPEEPESGISEEQQTPLPSTEAPVTGEATIIDTPEEKPQETSSEETQPPQAETPETTAETPQEQPETSEVTSSEETQPPQAEIPETTAETPQEQPETSEVTPTSETPEPPKSQKKKWLIVGIVVVIAIAIIPIGLQFLPTKSLEIAEVTPTEIISEQPIVSEELESNPELGLEKSKETVEPEELKVTETPIPEISKLPEAVTTETTPEISELPEAVTTETTPEISELPEAVTTETTPETEAVITEIIPEAETELVTPEVKPQKKPKIKFTPEQNFIAAIEKRVENLTTSYESDLVTTIEADLNSNKLLITVDDQWYELNSNRQDKVSNEILKRSRQLEFKKLIIQDSEGKLLARSPVVGDNMVILQRTHES